MRSTECPSSFIAGVYNSYRCRCEAFIRLTGHSDTSTVTLNSCCSQLAAPAVGRGARFDLSGANCLKYYCFTEKIMHNMNSVFSCEKLK